MNHTAIVLGVGAANGVGGAIARRFADSGHHVIVSGRTIEKLELVCQQINDQGGSAQAVVADVTSESDQDQLFAVAQDKGSIASVIFNAGNNGIIPFKDLSLEQFESFWRIGCLGAFITAKRALPLLTAQGNGSLLFTGASASMRGKPNFAHFASSKAALRNLVQALAREYGPQGVHVAHFIIDGVVNGDYVADRFGGYLDSLGEDGSLSPNDIADAFLMVHQQKRSAWTQELDLRPYKEQW